MHSLTYLYTTHNSQDYTNAGPNIIMLYGLGNNIKNKNCQSYIKCF